MLLIIGLDSVLRAAADFFPPPVRGEMLRQLGHVAWEGLSLYDLIFPVFVLISGAAMYASQSRAAEQGRSRGRSLFRLWRRACVLVLLGCLVNLDYRWGWHSLRYASVLGLIGLSCAVAGSVALYLRRWWQRAAVAVGILLAVGAAQYFGGDMTPSGCVNARIDVLICPGRLHLGVLDPEGPLCVVSASALCLLGMLAGELLAEGGALLRASAKLLGCGAGLYLLGMLSGACIKNIWTPAFVLSAAGIGYALLGVFHLLFDGGKLRWVAFPLCVVGCNALCIYMVTQGLPFEESTLKMFHVIADGQPPLCYALLYLLLTWYICWELWRKRLLVKI